MGAAGKQGSAQPLHAVTTTHCQQNVVQQSSCLHCLPATVQSSSTAAFPPAINSASIQALRSALPQNQTRT